MRRAKLKCFTLPKDRIAAAYVQLCEDEDKLGMLMEDFDITAIRIWQTKRNGYTIKVYGKRGCETRNFIMTGVEFA